MAISQQYNSVEYIVRHGLVSYAFSFGVEEPNDIQVWHTNAAGLTTTQLSQTQYQQTMNEGNVGGSIEIDSTLLDPYVVPGPSANYGNILIVRRTDRTQDLTLLPKAAVNPVQLEKALDHLEMQIQEIDGMGVSKLDLQAAVNGINDTINTEVNNRVQGDITNKNYIDQKVTVLQNVDDSLGTAIQTETTNRINADTALNTTINTRVTAEAAARQTADNTLQGKITAEETARKTADTKLTNDLAAETAARIAGDTLSSQTAAVNLALEKAERIASDTALQTGLTNETTARVTADGVLTTAVNGVKTRVDTLEKLGHHVGTFDTYADVPQNISGFPKGITINDFVRVRDDENHAGQLSQYAADGIASDGTIDWEYDFSVDDNADKIDRLPGATIGNYPVIDANGELEDSGTNPNSFVKPASVGTAGNLVKLTSLGGIEDANATVADFVLRANGARQGNFAAFNNNGGVIDSGFGASSFVFPAAGTIGNFAAINSLGHYEDSGFNFSSFATPTEIGNATVTNTINLNGLPANSYALKTDLTDGLNTRLALAGGVMSGPIDMANNPVYRIPTPVAGTDAANKKYVDDLFAPIISDATLPLAGGTMQGCIAMSGFNITGLGGPVNPADAVNKQYVDAAVGPLVDPTKLPLAGGTMGGNIDMGATNRIRNMADPTVAKDAATKAYVDANISGVGGPDYATETFIIGPQANWVAPRNIYVKALVSGSGMTTARVTVNGTTLAGVDDPNETTWVMPPVLVTAGQRVILSHDMAGATAESGIYTFELKPTAPIITPVITAHNELSGRNIANSHPMAAITGLEDALASVADSSAVTQAIADAVAPVVAKNNSQDLIINATIFIRAIGIVFQRAIGALTTVPKAAVTEIQSGLITPQPRMTMLVDPQGTIGYYVRDIDASTMEVRTLSTSFIGSEISELLGNVQNKSDLPATTSATETLFGRTPNVDDYARVLTDETHDNNTYEWYITSIAANTAVAWGNPIPINTSDYQAQSGVADSGKLLTGGASTGTFGPSVSIDSDITTGTGVPATQSVYSGLTALSDSFDDALAAKANTTDMMAALALKSDETSVVSRLALKANLATLDSYYTKATMDTLLADKAFASDLALLAPKANPTFTGLVNLPTVPAGEFTNRASTTSFVRDTAQWYSDNIDQPRVEVLDTDDSTTPLAPGHLRLITGASGGGGGGGGVDITALDTPIKTADKYLGKPVYIYVHEIPQPSSRWDINLDILHLLDSLVAVYQYNKSTGVHIGVNIQDTYTIATVAKFTSSIFISSPTISSYTFIPDSVNAASLGWRIMLKYTRHTDI